MKRKHTACCLAATLVLTVIGAARPSVAAEPVKLSIKPLLCVLDRAGASCAVTFDIRWQSPQPGEYCLNDSVQNSPLRCWPRTLAGEMQQERVFDQGFRFWLAPPAGGPRLSEVKIEVLRVGSSDRRRERRTRHVWDVL